MSLTTLSIKEFGLTQSGWNSDHGAITKDDLKDVTEHRTDSTTALNALPTPFARFYVVDEAFRRLLAERKDPRSVAGEAYHKLVSRCLDVYELLFNLNRHRSEWKQESGTELHILTWNHDTDLVRLSQQSPVLANSLSVYYSDDIGLDQLHFIVLERGKRRRLIAVSSPLTGFMTPPDMDSETNRYDGFSIRRPVDRGKEYFTGKPIDFANRSSLFKNYMFQLADSGRMSDRMQSLKEYIKSYKDDADIRIVPLETEPIKTDDGELLKVGGMPLSASTSVGAISYFNKTLIRLPYEISDENYLLPRSENTKYKTNRYLLPLTEEALQKLDVSNIDLKVKETSTAVQYYLELGEETESHTYNKDSSGQILDLEEDYHSNLELGIFPCIISKKETENNYFKVLLATRDNDENDHFKPSDILLRFYRNEGGRCVTIEETTREANFGVLPPVVRSRQGKDGNSCSTKYYELFNTGTPQAVIMSFVVDGKRFEGTLIPRMHCQKTVDHNFTYAVDLGTSYTYITRRDVDNNTAPTQLEMNSLMMMPLHSCGGNGQLPLIDRWEQMPFQEASRYFISEFTPPMIDGKRYRFPLRTALLRTEGAVSQPSLFDTHNIAFGYGRIPTTGDNKVSTQLKWNDGDMGEVRLYIRELIMIIRNDALQQGCDLSRIKLNWTYPLSFDANTKRQFDSVWQEEAKLVLGISSDRIATCSESMAPYYYFKELDKLKSVQSAVVIDIGGGTTDYVYFANNQPLLASSIRLGCDAIWGTGYSTITNDRNKNGLYNHLVSRVSVAGDDLAVINNRMTAVDSKVSTADVFNFWIAAGDKLKVDSTRSLPSVLRKEARHIFVYHLCTILYTISLTLKKEGYEPPRELLMCGGGSRYLDNFIDADANIQSRLAKVVFDHVWQSDTPMPHIHLDEKRKEATGYGALYATTDQVPNVLFIDEVIASEVMNRTESVTEQVRDMNRLYLKMLQVFDDSVDLEMLATELNDGLSDAVDKTLRGQVFECANKQKNYRGTLLTIPALDRLIALTHTLKASN